MILTNKEGLYLTLPKEKICFCELGRDEAGNVGEGKGVVRAKSHDFFLFFFRLQYSVLLFSSHLQKKNKTKTNNT